MIVFLGPLRGLSESEAEKRGRAAGPPSRIELKDWAGQKVQDLSKGMQQKVQFICTAPAPALKLVILDEPFGPRPGECGHGEGHDAQDARAGIDDRPLQLFRMEQVEKLCDSICLINKGHNVLDGDLRAIKVVYEEYREHRIHRARRIPEPSGDCEREPVWKWWAGELKPGGDPQEILKGARIGGVDQPLRAAGATKFAERYFHRKYHTYA